MLYTGLSKAVQRPLNSLTQGRDLFALIFRAVHLIALIALKFMPPAAAGYPYTTPLV
jgi:hypothetical protein